MKKYGNFGGQYVSENLKLIAPTLHTCLLGVKAKT